MKSESYRERIWKQFSKRKIGLIALYTVFLFCLIGIYAPFLASSKPLFVLYDGEPYFPLFRYLFYSGFYTKKLDIFFNLMIFTFPLFLLALVLQKYHAFLGKIAIVGVALAQFLVFLYFAFFSTKDPAVDPHLNTQQFEISKKEPSKALDWNTQLKFMTPYAKLNTLLRYKNLKSQHESLLQYYPEYVAAGNDRPLPSLWQMQQDHEKTLVDSLNASIEQNPKESTAYKLAEEKLNYLHQRREWLQHESTKIRWEIMPLFSTFHWEDDAGGQRAFNHYVPWWQLTRINGKDLLAALIFGVRISIVVGMTSVLIALIIGVPIGALAGFYGGKFDIVVSRLLEIWESMPAFFMLLMVVAILQSKSIFLVIAAIGLFGWTSFSRYVRGEFFKQRNLPYVEAGRALGFRDSYIIFKHILPNAIPPVLALMPFAIMGAITAEAGLSFLGLGEEGSTSWGVLMDEGRSAFPEDSFLLWPPATLLTIFLVAIALVGDDLRDALDPKLQR
jgi:peptide/nickel transport system permease protein